MADMLPIAAQYLVPSKPLPVTDLGAREIEAIILASDEP